ncbi:P-loop containing nucleoside triphosphate hydrolase protein [Pelagophyceae sp. CCMP2097]|nr:P-loop containing nucleoside triphosphate hydrolase protein [Pelagophyceae sp. CCMP2097]
MAARRDRCAFVRGHAPDSLFEAIASEHSKRATRRIPGGPGPDAALDRFVGQPGAVSAVKAKLRAVQARDDDAPTAMPPTVFYFYGVAGVGKTRLAELMAEAYGTGSVIRLAMEAYGAEEDANALFGAAPGLQQGVCLVDLLVEAPRSVVIFDEIEKAHASMLRSKLHTALSSGTMQHKRNASKVALLSQTIFVFTTNCFEAEVRTAAAALDRAGARDAAQRYESVRRDVSQRINDDTTALRCSVGPSPLRRAKRRALTQTL